jgi:hypothetical protein
MATRKEVIGFGMPWEDVYGYAHRQVRRNLG